MKILVCGAGGFIGSHLVKKLKTMGHYIVGVDQKYPGYWSSAADQFIIGDLRNLEFMDAFIPQDFDQVYQLAADMGGAGYIFSGDNDAAIMHNSVMINLNILSYFQPSKPRIFYSSSACIYPEYNQLDPDNPNCAEDTAYPAAPDSEYGWEKIFSERLYLAVGRNCNMDMRIARFHNIFGPNGTYQDGKEKAPAALCRKVAEAVINDIDHIEIWGDGEQTRSFLDIDECLNGMYHLMCSEVIEPLNIGSDEMITLNNLAKMIIGFSGKEIEIKHIEGPLGVRGRNSDNTLIEKKLGWRPIKPLAEGIERLYEWVYSMVRYKRDTQTTNYG